MTKCHLIVIFRLLTYKFRVLPKVIVLGEQKCGTTTLAYYLRTALNMKGPYSWFNSQNSNDKDSGYFRGCFDQYALPKYYPMCFSLKCLTNANDIYFDASPSYLYLPFVRDRIYKLHQDNADHKFKFIILTRNPIDRAISNFKTEVKYKQYMKDKFGAIRKSEINSLKDMIDYCQTEQFVEGFNNLKNIKWNQKIPDYLPEIERGGIIQRGLYHENIKWFFELDLFKSNTLILELDELSKSPGNVIKKVAAFIDVDVKGINYDKLEKIHLNKHDETLSDDEQEKIKQDKEILKEIYGKDQPILMK